MIPDPFLSQCKVSYSNQHDAYACFTYQFHEPNLYLYAFHRIMYDSSSQHKEFSSIPLNSTNHVPQIKKTPNSGHATHDSCIYIMLYSILNFYGSYYAPTDQLNSDYVMNILSLDLLVNPWCLYSIPQASVKCQSYFSVYLCFRSSWFNSSVSSLCENCVVMSSCIDGRE